MRLSAAVVGACLAVGALSAQQAPVFRTGVQFVSVDVVVTDADDRPIRDLTKDDFEIIDRGRTQTVTDFRFVDIPVTRATLADIKALPPASDVASNARPSPDSRLWVVVIDTLHTLESEIVPMKQVMHDFIRSIAPVDEVAIIYPNRSDLGTNFTTDRQRMLRAVDDLREASGFAIDAGGKAATTAGGGATEGKRAGLGLAFTLKQSALALAGSSHPRRALVLMGAGTPANMSGDAGTVMDVFEEFKDVYRVARESNVPIYTIDPRGMVQPADAYRGGIGAVDGPAGRAAASFSLRHQQANLHVAAYNTGGRAFVDQSNISRAMETLVEENGAFYLLGYYPDVAPLADRFNDIDVRVKRPGAKVRARRGYHAAGASIGAPMSPEERLAAAMSSAIDVRGITLRASVAPLLPLEKTMRTAVTVHVTYPVAPAGDALFDSLWLNIVALDGDAKVKTSVERGYTVRPPRSERESVAVVINEAIDLPSQPLTLRIGVTSRVLGRAGTLQIPVHAPKPSDSRIQMGAIVVGTPQAPGPPTLGDDFIKALVPFQPTTRRTFTQAQTLRIFAPLFWKGRETEARVVLTLTGEGVTLRREERLTGLAPVDGRRITSLDTLIGLDKLLGAFTLTIEASVKDGQTTSDSVRFEVTPGAIRRDP